MSFHIKRVYEPPADDDGQRVLVDRLWPRGVSKANAGVDLWLKAVAPSDDLRRQVHGGAISWPDFAAAYRRELAEAPARDAAAELLELGRKGRVTLLYAAKDEAQNNARALADWLATRA
ncbi:MAG: DUF488 family protein [Caulobacteraceae bacterium]|nr:DUF488 family protein [Caulobacteraceae bacterium]